MVHSCHESGGKHYGPSSPRLRHYDVAIISGPVTESTRQALVLTEDRLGHYPEFRAFFVRTFDLDRVGLSEPGCRSGR
jgi:hypothetical protein